MTDGRDYLIYLAIVCDGDYYSMLNAARSHLFSPSKEEVDKVKASLKCNVVTYLDENFPHYLKNITPSPLVLFYYGDLSLINDYNFVNNIAVIGTRKCSEYGVNWTKKIVSGIADRYTIVSGLASGIDAVAATAALDRGGKTVAVLGGGIDYIYPPENKDLYERIIASGGLVISEHPNFFVPSPECFPFRNRLIAGISRKVIVTEAHQYSGTSITVGFALSDGKEVMCVPYPLDVEDSFCNQLLYEGALLIRNSDDVISQMELGKEKII